MRFETVTTFKFKVTVFSDVGICCLVHKY